VSGTGSHLSRRDPISLPIQLGLPTRFVAFWGAQTVSLVGSRLTAFSIAVWVFERTKSPTDLALVLFATTFPGVVAAPTVGVYLDRIDRRQALVVGNAVSGGSVAVVASLALLGHLSLYALAAAVATSSIATTLHLAAFDAATAATVSREQLGRAAGLVQTSQGIANIVGPAAGGFLLVAAGLGAVVAIDAATFLAAIVVALAVLPSLPPGRDAAPPARGWTRFAAEAAEGVAFIRSRKHLMWLLKFFALMNFLAQMAYLLMTPLVLGFASPHALGLVFAASGAGFLLGSSAAAARPAVERPLRRVVVSGVLFGAALAGAGFARSAPAIALTAGVMLFAVPIAAAASQTVWLAETPNPLRGRVFATRAMAARFATPVAYLAAGPLAQHVFEPLLTRHGPLASTLGPAFGTGASRGIGLLFVIMGLAAVVAAAQGRRSEAVDLRTGELRAMTDERPFRVVVNHEEQYSVWPVDRELPAGWTAEGFEGPKQACLDHIDTVWTDMRPLSLRRAMEEEAAKQTSSTPKT